MRCHGFGCPRLARGSLTFPTTHADTDLPPPFAGGGFAAAGEWGVILELVFVVKIVTIHRASRGHSRHPETNAIGDGYHLVLGAITEF